MSHFLDRLGQFAARHPWRMVAAWLVVAVAAVMLNSSYGGETDDSFRLPGAESQRGAEAIEERFPQQSLFTSNVILHSEDGLTGPDARAAVGEAELEVAEKATGPVREAEIQVEFDGALGYAKPSEEPSSEVIAIAVAVVV